MWLVFKSRPGHSLPEILTGIFVVVLMSIPVYSFVNNFSEGNTMTQIDSLCTMIEMDISFSCSKALRCLKEQKIVYNKEERFYDFEFTEDLVLKINHYGQIEMGDSTVVEKDGYRYIIKIKPVSGAVTMEQMNEEN